jgi:uncharacterized protein involved in exopolysaccharide biosynthesis
LLIDSRTNILPSPQMRVSDANSEAAYVETQVGVLKTERIVRRVIIEQKLYERPEFNKKTSALKELPKEATDGGAPDASSDAMLDHVSADAVNEFMRRLLIKRSQPTYIIEVSFTFTDPAMAAGIANAVANTYLTDQLKSRERGLRSTSQWLQQRALDLRRETQAAENALDEFRTNNPSGSRGVLRDLESTAQNYRNISENFQKRFLETSQQLYFTPPDARIVSEAWPPADRTSPKRTLVLAIAAAIGLALGCLIALARGAGHIHTKSKMG